jgi:SAM-dependent methyltransferase
LIQSGFLHQRRLASVVEELRALGVDSLVDLGCGHGDLVARVLDELDVPKITGIDLCAKAIAEARNRFANDNRAHVRFVEADITAPLPLPARPDAAVLLEVIEHLPENRLRLMENALFGDLRPDHVLITTPNCEYNDLLGVPQCRYRHPDHKFEWDRATFARWANALAARHGYLVTSRCVAGYHPRLGGPSHFARFSLASKPAASI